MAPPLRAIISSILHHFLLAASMLAMASSSVELAEAPSGSGHRFELIRLPLTLRHSDNEYLMQLRIGDSWLSGLAGTGSDLIWTNNSQLIQSPTRCPPDEKQGCCCCFGLSTFDNTYGGSAGVAGFMGEATLTSQGSSYTLNIGCAVKFGCHYLSNNAKQDKGCEVYRGGGIVGLGRGELSLVTQLRLHNFSYCLAKHNSFIELNDSSVTLLKQEGKLNTTKFAPSNNGYQKADSRYYVNPKKIVLGGTEKVPQNVTDIPNACSEQGYKNGDGGMFIDSGTSFTMLPEQVLLNVTEHVTKLMNKELKHKNRSNKQKFACYDVVELPKDMPEMVLHFCDGAQLVIPVENYMYLDQADKEYCLVFQKAPDGMSILGNFQQQNMTMLFDIKGKTLSFMENKGCQAEEKKHAAV